MCVHRPLNGNLEIPFRFVAQFDDSQALAGGGLAEGDAPDNSSSHGGSIGDAIRPLAESGFTGVLRGTADGTPIGEVWLAGGRLYLATTPTSDDLAGVIFGADTGTLPEVQEMLAETSGDVTATLAERRPNSVPALGRLLHEHNLTALFEMMVAGPASYNSEPQVMHPLGPRFAESVDDLLGQAERRLLIWRDIAERIPTTSARFKLSPDLPPGVEERVFNADEWRYLALIGSGRSVTELINETGERAFRIMTSLYRLLLEGIITDA